MSRLTREVKQTIAKGGKAAGRAAVREGGKAAVRAAVREGAPRAAAAVRKAAPKAIVKVDRLAQQPGLAGMIGQAISSPFRALLKLILARLSEVSTGAAISGGLANYAMIISGGGSQTVGLASLGLSAIPALLPDGILSFRKNRRRKS